MKCGAGHGGAGDHQEVGRDGVGGRQDQRLHREQDERQGARAKAYREMEQRQFYWRHRGLREADARP